MKDVNDNSIEELLVRSGDYLMERVLQYGTTNGQIAAPIVKNYESTAPRIRKRRGLVFVGVMLFGGISAGGVAIARNLLDDSTSRMVEMADCGLDSSSAERRVSDVDRNGRTWEFWEIRRANEAAELVRVVEQDGKPLMSSLNCQMVSMPRTEPYVWSGPEVGGKFIEQGAVYGWLPNGAAQAKITMKSGIVVVVSPNAEGFFIKVVSTDMNQSTHGELMPAGLDVFDSNGALLFHRVDVMACNGNC